MEKERARGRHGERPARTDSEHAVVRLNHVSGPRQEHQVLPVRHHHQRLEPPQHAVRAPILRQFHGGPPQVPPELRQLRLELLEQGERVGGAPGESRDHVPVMEAPDLLRGLLEDDVPHRHLAVPGDGNPSPASDGDDRRSPDLRHFSLPSRRELPGRPASGCASSYILTRWLTLTLAYRCVVDSEACPSISWIARRSAPDSSRWVAKECRIPWGDRWRPIAPIRASSRSRRILATLLGEIPRPDSFPTLPRRLRKTGSSSPLRNSPPCAGGRTARYFPSARTP